MNESHFAVERRLMVSGTVAGRGVTDLRVLEAMTQVPRHVFVPETLVKFAYADGPLSIGHGQTISQPYVVALMCQALELRPTDRILEVGTGSGYAAAVLALLGAHVHTVERHEHLARAAAHTLRALGYDEVRVHLADGTLGLPSEGPFEAIAVAAAGARVPDALLRQLTIGGRLVMPVGDQFSQTLTRITRTPSGFTRERLIDVRFVPLVAGMGEVSSITPHHEASFVV